MIRRKAKPMYIQYMNFVQKNKKSDMKNIKIIPQCESLLNVLNFSIEFETEIIKLVALFLYSNQNKNKIGFK